MPKKTPYAAMTADEKRKAVAKAKDLKTLTAMWKAWQKQGYLDPADTAGLRGLYHHDLEAVEAPGVSPVVSTLATGTGRIRGRLART